MDKQLMYRMEQVEALSLKLGHENLQILAKFLKNRIMNPDSYVLLLGETSSGKSTLINGLIGKHVLYASSAPSTGAITEIVFQKENIKTGYYAINRDATIEEINEDLFDELTRNPDKDLQRLRLAVKAPEYRFEGMRLFDTPGYGSIISEHEEIIKEFIPNSDIIIYVVNYRIGIQENDCMFLRFLKELIREDVEIIVAINQCPANLSKNDKRISEIMGYANDFLHQEVKHFVIEKSPAAGQDEYPLPEARALWQYVEYIINQEKRQQSLEEVFNGFILDLFTKCENEVNKRYQSIKLNQDEKAYLKKRSEELKDEGDKIVEELIRPEFERIIEQTDTLLGQARANIYNKVTEAIDNQDNGRMDETITYVTKHLLPFATQEEMQEVSRYINVELNDLNEKVNDKLNTQVMKFQRDIEIRFTTALEDSRRGILKTIGSKSLNGGLVRYFAAFGGRGGAGAGVANAASHALKVVGDFFRKTFSRQTHNALKHTLSKIGATSAKAIGFAASIIIEVAMVIVDYTTWKYNLKKKVKKGVDNWYSETRKVAKDDLNSLREENVNTINEIINDQIEAFKYEEEIPDEAEVLELLEMVEETRIKIGAK